MGTSLIRSSRVLTGTVAAVVLSAVLACPTAAAPADPRASGPTAPLATDRARAGIPVEGTIAVQLDLPTASVTPTARNTRCILRVPATLELVGAVDGEAAGMTTATINAPCSEVTMKPPGTFSDTFRFTGDFDGEVTGVPASADVEYVGVTRPGGEVSAALLMHGDATVVSSVRAVAGEGGTYRGVAVQGSS